MGGRRVRVRVCRVFESERLLAPASNSIEPEAQGKGGVKGLSSRAQGGSMGLALLNLKPSPSARGGGGFKVRVG
jgi:hypothetical protein